MRILAVLAASYSAAVGLAVYFGIGRWLLIPGCILGGLCAFILLLGKNLRRRGKAAGLCALGLSVGFLWCYGYDGLFVQPARELDERTVILSGRVLDWPKEDSGGYSVLVRADTPSGRGVDTLLYIDEQGADLMPGDRITSVVWCSFADHTFSGEQITYYTARGVFLRGEAYGTMTVERGENLPLSALAAVISRRLEESILDTFSQDVGGKVLAVVTGNREHLSRSYHVALQRSGLSHTSSVSGMHMAYLAGVLSLILGKYRKSTSLMIIPFCLLFMLVAGCTPSVTRAAVMIVMLHLAPLFQRSRDDVTALGAAALVLLLHNPLAIANEGLQLSFGAVAGIYLVGDRFGYLLHRLLLFPDVGERHGVLRVLLRLPMYVISTLSATLGAMLFTFPLSAYHFSNLTLIAPVSNVLTLWAVGGVFCGGMAVGMTVRGFSSLAHLIAYPVTVLVEYTDRVMELLGQIPYSCVTLDSFYYKLWTFFLSFVILLILLNRSRAFVLRCTTVCAAALLCAVWLTAAEFNMGDLSVTMLDVGQGQCIIVRQGEHIAVVDCGGDSYENAGNTAANYLQNSGIRSIDLLVLTHYHQDHANGVLQLMHRLDVDCIAAPKPGAEDDLGREIGELARSLGTQCLYIEEDRCLEVGEDSTITLYAPLGRESVNERGLTALVCVGETQVLFTGDMGSEVERLLLRHTRLPDIEILVAGHHGSEGSTSEKLLQATRPETVLISVGEGNRYGHPSAAVLERLKGCDIYRTDRNGTVTVRFRNP